MSDGPKPSPRPPDDSAPLASDKTPAHFPVTAEYVKKKLAESGRSPSWVPKRRTPMWAALFVATVSGAAPALLSPEFSPRIAGAMALIGAATGLATYFGMQSAGTQR